MTIEVKELIRNYIPLFYVDVMTYPCLNPDAGLVYLRVSINGQAMDSNKYITNVDKYGIQHEYNI